MLESRCAIEELARELAEEVEQRSIMNASPGMAEEHVASRDAVRVWVRRIVMNARRRSGKLPPGAGDEPLARLATQSRALVRAVVIQLARDGELYTVLAVASESACLQLAQSLGLLPASATGAQPQQAQGDVGEHGAHSQSGLSAVGAHLLHWATAKADEQRADLETTRRNAPATAPHSDDVPSGSAPGISAIERTLHGGLVYLLNCLLDLDVGQLLFSQCLDEGAVLSAALAALVPRRRGKDSLDPIIRALCCRPTSRNELQVDPKQQRAVASALLRATAAAILRQESTELPSLLVWTHDHELGPIITAAPEESPLVAFAAPARTLDETRAAMAMLVNSWPRAAAIRASPPLAALDPSGRSSATREMRRGSVMFARAESAPAVALCSQVVGAACLLFCIRVGQPVDSTDMNTRFFGVDATIRRTDDELTVALPMDAIELAVRRAGLDRDPGWVPWLQRNVRLCFEPSLRTSSSSS